MTRRILFLAPSYACDASTGGGQRTLLLYEALAAKYEVDTLIVDEWGGQGGEAAFSKSGKAAYFRVTRPGKRGITKLLQSFNPDLADTVSTALRGRQSLYEAEEPGVSAVGYDGVVARYLRPAARAGVLRNDFDKPVLIDIDDRDDQVLDARLAEAGNPAVKALLRKHRDDMKEIFRDLTAKAAHLFVVTEEDRDAISHPSISLLPNIPFGIPAEAPAPAQGGQTVLFVGAGGHRPNVEGVLRFVANAWPKVRESAPQAELRIVGSGPWENHADKLAAPGVALVGRVDDLGAEYARANLAVCPVFEGGGSKIKVLEAFAYNRPIVSASHSARGFVDRLVNDAILSASDEAGMAAHCLTLLNDPALSASRAEIGRRIVVETYSRKGFSNAVAEACDQIIGAN